MTIEEKAKRFDETLEQLKGLIEVTREDKCDIAEEDIIDIFPELKESEDERIRKEIIKYVKEQGDKPTGLPNGTVAVADMIAWLEKQGESTDINPSEFDLRLNKLLKQFETLPKEELASSLSFYLNVVQNDGTYKAEEKQGEQKPTDEVEPKFKVGDWIVDNCGYVWKIEGILNQFYLLEGVEGGESRPTIEWVDKTFHLWTIQDAKDGDVLAAGPIDNYHFSFIAIYKNRGLDFFNSYCFIDFDGKFYEGDTGHALDDIHPATKEQYDLLLQKMHDAGYEFDFEQKELKEIELTKSESEEELSDFEAALFSAFSDGWQQYLHGEEVDFAQWAKEHSAELLEAANQNHVAWSEEDEEFLRRAIKATKDVYPVTANWLKSLKDRIQPKQEWSEEDSYMLESIVSDFAAGHKSSIGQDKWLKSLKPQNHWKPTKDQMEALHDLNLTGNISYAGQGQVLIELYNDLYKISNVKDK